MQALNSYCNTVEILMSVIFPALAATSFRPLPYSKVTSSPPVTVSTFLLTACLAVHYPGGM